jgi:hypothetical protein
MFKIKNILLFLVASLVVSCSTIDPKPNIPTPEHRQPQSNAATLFLKNNTYINNESQLAQLRNQLSGSKYYFDSAKNNFVWDLNGGILDGKNQKGDGGQSEDQEPLFRCNISLVVKNGFVRNNKDAMMFNVANSGIVNMTWLTVGEDAVSTHRTTTHFVVENCEFINHSKGDKTIQLNNGANARLSNNLIFSGRTGVRLFSSINSTKDTAIAKNNRFVGCDTGYNIEYGTLTSENDSFEEVRLPFKLVHGAKVDRK